MDNTSGAYRWWDDIIPDSRCSSPAKFLNYMTENPADSGMMVVTNTKKALPSYYVNESYEPNRQCVITHTDRL